MNTMQWWECVVRRATMACAVGLSLAGPCWSQVSPDYFSLQKAVARMADSPYARSSGAISFNDLVDRVDRFQSVLQEAGANSAEDAAAVWHLASVLDAVSNSSNVESASGLAGDASRDLDLKIKYYSNPLGVVGNARGLVKVTVRTLRDGEAVKGLVVYCNPYRWADATKPMQTFPTLSSPTEASMMAGYYRCVASDGAPEKQVGSRDVAIGLDGADSLTIDLAVTK